MSAGNARNARVLLLQIIIQRGGERDNKKGGKGIYISQMAPRASRTEFSEERLGEFQGDRILLLIETQGLIPKSMCCVRFTPLDDLSACGRVLGYNSGGLADSWTGRAMDDLHRLAAHNMAKGKDLNEILIVVDGTSAAIDPLIRATPSSSSVSALRASSHSSGYALTKYWHFGLDCSFSSGYALTSSSSVQFAQDTGSGFVLTKYGRFGQDSPPGSGYALTKYWHFGRDCSFSSGYALTPSSSVRFQQDTLAGCALGKIGPLRLERVPVGDATGAGAGAVVGEGWGSWRLLAFFGVLWDSDVVLCVSSDSGYALIFFRQCAVLTEYWRQSSGYALTPSSSVRFQQDTLAGCALGKIVPLVRATPSQNSGTLAVIVPLVRATPSHPRLPCSSRKGAHSSGSALTKYRCFEQNNPLSSGYALTSSSSVLFAQNTTALRAR
ncbi:hypothetical protein F5H01DRAFT_417932 [Linnemannia elongata]|nr:hypothetical protein F5H01DRAFT_417932 [Linnemannia elongata]